MSQAPPTALPPTSPGGQNVTYYVYQMQAPDSSGAKVEIDWSVCFTQYFLRSLLMFINLAAWVLLLAGISQCQNECNKDVRPFPFTDIYSVLQLTQNAPVSASDCIKYFSLTWWSVWLQFITVMLALGFTIQFFARYKQLKAMFTTTMYFFIMSTVLLFFIADKYSNATYIIVNKDEAWSSAWKSGTTLLTVGSIVSLVFNFFWIIWNSYADVPTFPGHVAPPVIDADATVGTDPAAKA